MLHQSRGIVLHTVNYSETSIIVKIYTEQFGLQSYLVKGSRKKGASMKPVLFQSLSLLDLTVYHREKQRLQTIREARFAHPYQSVPFDIRKSSVALFLNELLYKTIREEESNPELFNYLFTSLIRLDELPSVGNFHLVLIIRVTRYLGFYPLTDYDSGQQIFNLREGVFQTSPPDHPDFFDPETSGILYQLMTLPTPESESLKISRKCRDLLVEKLLLYYRFHLPGFTGLNSVPILHEVLA